jgi:ribosomal-protein-alanine N-acetyltransferase
MADTVRSAPDMASIPALDQPLRNERVGLRLADERDIPEILIAHQDDPQLYARLGLRRPPSGAELGRQMEAAERERETGMRARLTILQPGSDDCRGRVSVHSIDWNEGRAELGIWLAPQVRGRGLAAAALRLVVRWLFDDWGISLVQLLTEPGNEPMLHAARSAGFVERGMRRRADVDMIVLSLSRDEPAS